MASGTDWTGEEVAVMRGLIRICATLRKVDSLMTVTNAQTLLEVAIRDSEESRSRSATITELAELVGTQQSNMSRILRLLGAEADNRGRRAGLGLVNVVTDPVNYRERRTKLTAQGKRLVRSICSFVA